MAMASSARAKKTKKKRTAANSRLDLLIGLVAAWTVAAWTVLFYYQSSVLQSAAQGEAIDGAATMGGREGPPAVPPRRTTTTAKYNHPFANVSRSQVDYPYVPISVIVPATSDQLLGSNVTVGRLLDSISRGTLLPAEVVISVSKPQKKKKTKKDADVTRQQVPSAEDHEWKLSIPHNLHVVIVYAAGIKCEGAEESGGQCFAGANRNRAARHSTMPVLSAVDSDDIVGYDWMETIFNVFNTNDAGGVGSKFQVDALLHRWFPCTEGPPPVGNRPPEENEWTLSTSDRMIILNDILPLRRLKRDAERAARKVKEKNERNEMFLAERVFSWVASPVRVKEKDQMFGEGMSHPYWQNGHISIKRDVYLNVMQREDNQYGRKGQDSRFVADLLLRGYRVGGIKNQLTGYCRF